VDWKAKVTWKKNARLKIVVRYSFLHGGVCSYASSIYDARVSHNMLCGSTTASLACDYESLVVKSLALRCARHLYLFRDFSTSEAWASSLELSSTRHA
jgi:hypothetical protein